MSDIYLQEDIAALLDNRFIVIIGDSIQRGVYKDMVLLLQRNKYLTDSQLRSKGEFTYCGDKLVEGGQHGEMTNGVKYREVRQYQTDHHLVRFYFVTRCYNQYVESILKDLADGPTPDLVLMNSCLWDISRYGAQAVDHYKENLDKLFKRFKAMLPPSCLIIWNMTLPISKKARGGFLIPAVEFMNSTLRLDILEANFFVHKLAMSYGFNTLDLHYFLRHQLQRRAGDGVHWDMTAHRRMSNLILSHVAQSWNVHAPDHTRKFVLTDNQSSNMKKNSQSLLSNLPVNVNRNQPNRPVGRISPQFQDQVKSHLSKNFNERYFSHHRDSNGGLMNNNCAPNVNNLACLMSNGINVNGSLGSQWQPGQYSDSAQNQYNSRQNEYNDQWQNIQRYGGPIRSVNFQSNMNMMTMGNEMSGGTNLNWEPYRNQVYNPNLRGGHTNAQYDRNRNVPYGSQGRRRSRFDH